MSFRNTKTPNKPTTPAKWQVPMRPNPTSGMKEYYLEGELKERFCKLFPKNSNIRIPSSPLSHSASAHKHAMIKACNYFADPLGDPHVICYDSETQRSARREATAAKYGLKGGEADE